LIKEYIYLLLNKCNKDENLMDITKI